MAVHVLDRYYLAITLLVTVGYQLLFFSIAFTLKFDKLTDFAGGTNFVFVAILTLAMSGTHEARQIVASLFLMVWAARLSGFLLFRIIKTGTDTRFDDKRDKFFPFLGFWVFQMFWVWTVAMPVTILNSPAVLSYSQPSFGKATDIIGVILYACGLFLEAVGDAQKYRFRTAHQNDKGAVCDKGVWSWSRHPNYAGEIAVQFGIWMVAIAPATVHYVHRGAMAALYASVVGPLFLTLLLLFVSGLTLQERPGAKKRYEHGTGWEEYKMYLERTSILIPMPQAVWSRLPTIVKRTVGIEWPMYVFDPAKHADKAKASTSESGQSDRALENGAHTG